MSGNWRCLRPWILFRTSKCSWGCDSTPFLRNAQAQEQELELPEDMALDDDGMGGADEAENEGQDGPDAEADAPEERSAEQREAPAPGEGGDGEQADKDADMADQDQHLEGAQGPAVVELGSQRLPVGPVESPVVHRARSGLSRPGRDTVEPTEAPLAL